MLFFSHLVVFAHKCLTCLANPGCCVLGRPPDIIPPLSPVETDSSTCTRLDCWMLLRRLRLASLMRLIPARRRSRLACPSSLRRCFRSPDHQSFNPDHHLFLLVLILRSCCRVCLVGHVTCLTYRMYPEEWRQSYNRKPSLLEYVYTHHIN